MVTTLNPKQVVSFEEVLMSRVVQKDALTNTNALNILTLHGVIASPKGAAISFFMGLLRRSAPRNDKLLIAFALGCLREVNG